MDKEFYHFLYNLRSSGFFYPTQEITRQLLFFSRTVCCIIEIPKVADQKWRKLHLHFGESCKTL